MSTIVRRNVGELPEASRHTIEQLVGRPLEPDQRVFIIVEAPLIRASELRRRHSARRVDSVSAPRIPHE
jgi:hypothetical protein